MAPGLSKRQQRTIMSEIQIIETTVDRAGRRRRLHQAWLGFWWGSFAGAVAWLIVLAVYKLFPVPVETLTVGAGLAGVAALIGVAAGWLRAPSRMETARWLDGKSALKERLSTALELSQDQERDHWSRLVVTDAAAHASKLDPGKLLPFSLPRASRWALVALAVGAGLGFVPERRSDDYLQQKRETENIQDTGRHLEEIAKRQLAKRKPVLPQTEKAMQEVAEIGQTLQKKKLTRNEALAELSKVQDKIKDQTQQLAKKAGIRKLQRAARQSGGEMAPSAESIQKQIDAMKKQLEGKDIDGKTEALEKLEKAMEKLKDAAAAMGQEGSQSDGKASQEMFEAMDELMQQAKDLGLDMNSLDEASEALNQGEIDKFLKDMDVALVDLGKLQQFAKKMSELKKQLADIGEDLPERLEKGQGIPAIARMQKLARQLKSEKTTEEELKQAIDEIRRSVDPAMDYEKVADYIQEAATLAEKGDREGAAKALEAASKEMEGLLKQCADCEGLLASLQAMQTASICIGNCQGWGQCSSDGPPRAGNGGNPGKGVGTWADDSLTMQPPDVYEAWDNSGVVRPDMEGKGISDRGEGELAEGFLPTKVKGQMGPGGQMPSITLKGVSIKGRSSIQYEEAVAAAQNDARSALSQERVPRAYQGAVRDYFDDLK